MTIAAGQPYAAADLLSEHNANGSHKAATIVSAGHPGGTNTHAQIDTFISAIKTSSSNLLTGDVTMVTPNTFYTGPTLTLAAGTWLLIGAVTVYSAQIGADAYTAKLWNGTTVAASGTVSLPLQYYAGTITLSAVVVLAGSETWKISATANTTANQLIVAATPTNSAGNNASFLYAIKLGV